MLGVLFEISQETLHIVEHFGERPPLVRLQFLHQLVGQLDRELAEVVDEVERVFDFVGNPGGERPERGHLLGVDEVVLRGLQFAERTAQSLVFLV